MSFDENPRDNDPHAECAHEIACQKAAYDGLLNFLKQCDTKGGRIVSMNDLNNFQIGAVKAAKHDHVIDDGFGFAFLPWDLTTDKDRERERPVHAAGEPWTQPLSPKGGI